MLYKTLVLYRKRADEKAVGQREGPIGALSIQPFEGSRVTTLWSLNCVFVLGGGSVHDNGVCDGRVSEAAEAMGVSMGL